MSDKTIIKDMVKEIKENLYDNGYTMTRYGSYTGIIQQMRKDIETLLEVIEKNDEINENDLCICGDADRKRNGCCRNCGEFIK